MPGNVADASLLAAVAFGEPQAADAVALIGDGDLHEPILLGYELASAARKKISRVISRTLIVSGSHPIKSTK